MHDYWIWDSVVPKWFCEEQIKALDWNQTKEGEVYQENIGVVDKQKRITDIIWLDNIRPIGCIAQTYIHLANKEAGWNFDITNCEKIQIGRYNSSDKGFYDWHSDDGWKPNQNNFVRKLSISILLSDTNNFEGGIFEFKNFKNQPIMKQGSILVFPSMLEHRVSSVTLGTRYSAVTWAGGPAYK
jgi:PKHD-type hydroxylase